MPFTKQNSPFKGFHKTQSSFMQGVQRKRSIESNEEERASIWSHYIPKARGRRQGTNDFENTSVFRSEKRNSMAIPKCVKVFPNHIEENPYFNLNLINKKSKPQKKSYSKPQRQDEKVKKMYEMDKIQRKVSPSLLLDNYMIK